MTQRDPMDVLLALAPCASALARGDRRPLAALPSVTAPEDLDRHLRGTDETADIYRLAYHFLWQLSGREPLPSDRPLELVTRLLDRMQRPSARSLDTAIGSGIERVLERALRVDPELRYRDVATFWKALEDAVAAAPRLLSHRTAPPAIRRTTVPMAPIAPVHATVAVSLVLALVGLEEGGRALGRLAMRRSATTGTAPRERPQDRAPEPTSSHAPAAVASSAASASAPQPEPLAPEVELPVPLASPPFAIDQTEVTVRHYRQCVEAQACVAPPVRGALGDRRIANDPAYRCNYHQPARQQHPVNCISLAMARSYCRFRGKKLPTGRQWEFAARGTNRWRYPFEEPRPRCSAIAFARYGSESGGCPQEPRGTRPALLATTPSSPFRSYAGALDMAGNLWEWTEDMDAAGLSVLRGGAWDSNEQTVTLDARLLQSPANTEVTLGFRCIREGE